jgi:hypothetical protein
VGPELWRPAALGALLAFGVLTTWVEERWAVAAFQTAIFLVGGLRAGSVLWGAGRPRGTPLLAILFALPVVGLAQVAAGWTVYPFETWKAVLHWEAMAVVFWLALDTLGDAPLRRGFLRGFLYAGFALALAATLQAFSSGGRVFWLFPSGYEDMVFGPFVYQNDFAAFLELLLPLALVEMLESGGTAALPAALVAMAVASGSRAGCIILALETVAVIALSRTRRPQRRLAPMLARLAAMAVLFSALAGVGYVTGKFRQADPFSVRRELLESSLAMCRDRPLTGFGLGAWPVAYPQYALFDRGLYANHAHNDWAEWAAEGGVGFLLMLAVVAVAVFRYSARRPWGLGAAAVLIHSLVDYPMQRPALAALVFALAGAMATSCSRTSPVTPLSLCRSRLALLRRTS